MTHSHARAPWPFSLRQVPVIALGFVLGLLALGAVVRATGARLGYEVGPFWPLSVFAPRVPGWKHLLAASVVLALFYFVLRNLATVVRRPEYAIVAGVLLILGTNLTQGWTRGFVVPSAGLCCGGLAAQYYHDAVKITSPVYFVSHYNDLQTGLQMHARIHPPGAVMAFYFLWRLLGNPGLISVAIAVLATTLSMACFCGLLREELDRAAAVYVTLTFSLVPAIQIYYAASLDALIAACFLAVLWCFVRLPGLAGLAAGALFLFLGSSMTYSAFFLVPLLFGFELLRRRSVLRASLVMLGTTALWSLIFLALHFNYVKSFLIARALVSSWTHPQGFSLFSYSVTFLENVLEIVVFTGPFLCILFLRGLRRPELRRSALGILAVLAVLSLLAIFLSYSYASKETGRICLFIYPYLLFPVALYVDRAVTGLPGRIELLVLVFGQSLAMQLFGFYFW